MTFEEKNVSSVDQVMRVEVLGEDFEARRAHEKLVESR